MNTYVLNILNKFKTFCDNMDVSAAICNKTWVVFNDSGERELYLFQQDGSVIITTNGIGFMGKWQWIPANNSLIIQQKESVLMFHPRYIDDMVLALTLDGTNLHSFLIEDKNRQMFVPKTLADLQMYFDRKEMEFVDRQQYLQNKTPTNNSHPRVYFRDVHITLDERLTYQGVLYSGDIWSNDGKTSCARYLNGEFIYVEVYYPSGRVFCTSQLTPNTWHHHCDNTRSNWLDLYYSEDGKEISEKEGREHPYYKTCEKIMSRDCAPLDTELEMLKQQDEEEQEWKAKEKVAREEKKTDIIAFVVSCIIAGILVLMMLSGK